MLPPVLPCRVPQHRPWGVNPLSLRGILAVSSSQASAGFLGDPGSLGSSGFSVLPPMHWLSGHSNPENVHFLTAIPNIMSGWHAVPPKVSLGGGGDKIEQSNGSMAFHVVEQLYSASLWAGVRFLSFGRLSRTTGHGQ